MKKTLLSIIMTIGILSSNAQVMEPFFPRDSNLFYQWWYEDLLADSISLYFESYCYILFKLMDRRLSHELRGGCPLYVH